MSSKIKVEKLSHWSEASQTADPKSFAVSASGRQHWEVIKSTAERSAAAAQMGSTQNPETESPRDF